MALYPTKLTGKSNVAFYKKGGTKFKDIWVELKDITANATFVLPANVALIGTVILVNTSGTTQAAITVGFTAAGTEIITGTTCNAGLSRRVNGTMQTPSNVDRTVYVESTAWQAGVHVYLLAVEYPMTDDRTAKS